MAYLAFYRAFRPMSFDEVVRQEHIVRTLRNQISTGKIGHAYLFCGPRGTGKTTLAKIFARAVNCLEPADGSPCGQCAACKALSSGSNLDITEIDAASNNGVDEMRDLREMVQYPPVAGRYKVYIIDEVHMLTPSAFNAVLKTLEEPPRHAIFILATTEPQKIPATILSRCMRFDFKLIPQKDLEGLVRSVLDRTGKSYEPEAVSAIARAGAGSARDSLSIADMCASYARDKLTYSDVAEVLGSADFDSVAGVMSDILEERSDEALAGVERILSTGKSVGVLVKDMLVYLNNCTIIKVCKNAREIVNLPPETYSAMEKAAEKADGHKLLRVTEILAKCETDLRYALNGRITLGTAVLKCALPASDYNIDALIGRINALERKLNEGIEVRVRASAPQLPVRQSAPQAEKPPAAGGASANALQAERRAVAEELPEPPPEEPTPLPEAPEPQKTAELHESGDGFDPFSRGEEPPAAKESFQPSLWDTPSVAPKEGGTLSEKDKQTLFARFVRSLRTTRRNAVLFTLCMDLGSFFEGDKLILTTESEAVFKGLNREDNAAFVGETLTELGVSNYEVRLATRSESEYEKALGELRENFRGIDIEIK